MRYFRSAIDDFIVPYFRCDKRREFGVKNVKKTQIYYKNLTFFDIIRDRKTLVKDRERSCRVSAYKIRLLGSAQVTKDEEQIVFSYGKVNALVYYLFVHKNVSRDEIAGLLWADEGEAVAKKNLRNAIYKAKSALGEDIILSPKKSVLVLNPDKEIDLDVDEYMKADAQRAIGLYRGEFLQGFYVKNAKLFEEWMMKTRYRMKKKYIDSLNICMEKALKDKDTQKAEDYAKSLIQIDEFDENPYRVLMNLYRERGNYAKVLECYHTLADLLDRELGIKPDELTKQIFCEAFEKMNDKNREKTPRSGKLFYGRYNELLYIESNIREFKQGERSYSILITGEAGVGKSRLKEKAVESVDEDFYILETSCYQVEKSYLLRPWSSIIDELSKIQKKEDIKTPAVWNNMIYKIFPEFREKPSDQVRLIENMESLRYEMMGEIILEAMRQIARRKKLILVFEDIQWMDEMSLSLLSQIMLHNSREDLILLATARNEYDEKLDSFITTMKNHDRLILVELQRLDIMQTESFIRKALPDYRLTKASLQKIWTETEGNFFFLNEYLTSIRSNRDLNVMTAKMQDVIKSRFMYLSEEAKKLLNIASLFFDEIPLGMLKQLTGKDELSLMDIIEELENRYILEEVNKDEKIAFRFTHSKLREYVYLKQSEARKKILHQKVAGIIEAGVDEKTMNLQNYHRLVYHYSNAGMDEKALDYRIRALNYYLNFSHELFPILTRSEQASKPGMYLSREQTEKNLRDIEEALNQVKSKSESYTSFVRPELSFLHMKGRYLIRDGSYREGVGVIQELIRKATEIKDKDYALEGYKQMIYYLIQTNNPDMMMKYIELALELAVECNYHKEIGIILRLKGLYYIMTGNNEEAERLLNESINTFHITKQVADKYSLNIAGAYNYIGEIRHSQGCYQEALDYYEKALAICKDKYAQSSMSVFYINAGKTAFAMEEFELSKEYMAQAYSLYGKFDSFWKRAILDSYRTLLYIRDREFQEAVKTLKNADIYANKMNTPGDLGVVFWAKAELCMKAKEDREVDRIFKETLEEDFEFYAASALEHLDKHRDSYEINRIRLLKKNRA